MAVAEAHNRRSRLEPAAHSVKTMPRAGMTPISRRSFFHSVSVSLFYMCMTYLSQRSFHLKFLGYSTPRRALGSRTVGTLRVTLRATGSFCVSAVTVSRCC